MMEECRSLTTVRPPLWKIEPFREVSLSDGRIASLRPLAAEDANLMAEFFADLTEREIHYFFALADMAARQLALDVAAAPAYRLIAIGDLDGTEHILGYMFLHWKGEELPSFGACLRKEAQSGGLGRAMMEHLLTSAAASGVERVQLTVHPDNWRALRLYQRLGFRIIGEFINQHQGIKQYRMGADLRLPLPVIAGDVTIIPRGGIGVGLAAERIQQALGQRMQCLPLILDRPTHPDSQVIFLVDLAVPPLVSLPFSAIDSQSSMGGADWIVQLDTNHLLIVGTSPEGVDSAAKRFLDQPNLFSFPSPGISNVH
jgi:ribosomal protein S18 acetylase RimI-like enzyme